MIRISLLATGLLLAALGASPAAEIPKPEHPEPQAVRKHWSNLNGPWDFRFDPADEGLKAGWHEPGRSGFDRTIVVPFPWESELSGIGQAKGAPKVGWYRRGFEVPADFPADQRVWLHFGAVDHRADVWVNGTKVAEHEGGYTPFSADVTEALRPRGEANVVVVRAFDPTDPELPTGKQVGWYTPASGIWQTVWLEARPATHIARWRVETTLDRATFHVELAGRQVGGYALAEVVSDDPSLTKPRLQLPAADGDPARDRAALEVVAQEPKLWTPETPHLYKVTLQLRGKGGEVLDAVETYFGLRTIARGTYGDEPFERLLLNGKPFYLRAALDQSFNPRGIYTAPSDEFLKGDIELAKRSGLNALRIHIKPDEPRRLYWADTLGVLIMQDMPNTWEQSPKARKAWEATMREAIPRDINHPSLFAWVAFNETWGLGHPEPYKADKDTQRWVKAMVAAIRQLDPTRLVEDNSPCYYDHVEGSDLNSWHFYIDDHADARRHIEEVAARHEPGSTFNYCPGERMNSAPLINSEYGGVSAGGGDRDVSWSFRDLTTLLRKQPKIQGYVYTELTDIEWEHNGFADYDRTAKTFGYDAFVPGMTVADLQGADFVGYDGPPAIVARPGETVRVPVFVSHYSDRTTPPTLRWWVTGHDNLAEKVEVEPRERPVEWVAYGVKTQEKPVAFKVNAPFVGAIGLELVDEQGKRIAANFINVVIRPDAPQPRLERVDDRTALIRFAPGDFAARKWTGPSDSKGGKVAGRGTGYFEYRIRVPEAIARAHPTELHLWFEASARAGRERVDWPERTNAQDNPQTDATKWPSSLKVSIAGGRWEQDVTLEDDPADARGVLSHLARVDHGSHGQVVEVHAPIFARTRTELLEGQPLVIRLEVPDDAESPGGLCLFGADSGRYPLEPSLAIRTEQDLPADLGAGPDAPIAVDRAADRERVPLAAADRAPGGPAAWAFTTQDPGAGWAEAGFDAAGWSRGPAGFGTRGTPAIRVGTVWDTPEIWLRTTVDLPGLSADDELTLRLFHDEDVEVHVNGRKLYEERGYTTSYREVPLDAARTALFRPGLNVLAVRCRQTGGGQGIDLGLGWLKAQP